MQDRGPFGCSHLDAGGRDEDRQGAARGRERVHEVRPFGGMPLVGLRERIVPNKEGGDGYVEDEPVDVPAADARAVGALGLERPPATVADDRDDARVFGRTRRAGPRDDRGKLPVDCLRNLGSDGRGERISGILPIGWQGELAEWPRHRSYADAGSEVAFAFVVPGVLERDPLRPDVVDRDLVLAAAVALTGKIVNRLRHES